VQDLKEYRVWDSRHTKKLIFKKLGVLKTRGYVILRKGRDTDRTFPSGKEEEARGTKHIIIKEEIYKME
jgi:hypothetical protein